MENRVIMDIKNKLYDDDIKKIFYVDVSLNKILHDLTQDDIFTLSSKIQIPFFATIRDYKGAYYNLDPESVWMVKPLKENELRQARLGMFAYFINHFTGTISAPTIVTKFKDKYFKASKIIPRTEQLSGAPYHENKYLSAQLVLDLINSWIFFDEDRNPNNYLIYYNKRDVPVVVAIDFSNIDLVSDKLKIKGRIDIFGWERQEKTRYMTPLKLEQFYDYTYDFYKLRLKEFQKIDKDILMHIGQTIFRDDYTTEKEKFVQTISANILNRISYVSSYIESWFNDPNKLKQLQKRPKKAMQEEYRLMGKFFNENLNQ